VAAGRIRRKLRGKRRELERLGWRKMLGRPAHELRWRLSSPEARARWADERLALDGDYWLFLLGLNNSGTSILSRILASHPRVRSLPNEGQLLTPAFPSAPRHGVGRNWTKRPDVFRWTEASDPAPALRARFDWAYLFEPGPGILLEKSPPDTIRARWLQANFRPSRFVAVTRHPYAVCEGIRRRTGLAVEEAAQHWTRGNEILLEDVGHLERCLALTYETLTEDPEEELERVRSFLELEEPFDPDVVSAPILMHNITGQAQPIQNLNARSLERLSPEDLAAIDRIAGPLMERLGYERRPTRRKRARKASTSAAGKNRSA
jgi:Sulfotransferase family